MLAYTLTQPEFWLLMTTIMVFVAAFSTHP